MADIYQFTDPFTEQARGAQAFNALRGSQMAETARQGTLAAGNALAGGDPASAVQDLQRSGQFDQADQVTKGQQAEQDRALKFTVGAVTRLQDIHRGTVTKDNPQGDVNRTLAAFDALAPQFKTLAGESDDDLAQIRAHIAQDPEGTLTALGAGAAKQYQAVQGKNGGLYAFDAGSGTAKTVVEPDDTPKAEWKEVKNADGTTRFINLNDPKTWGPGVGAAQAAAAASAPGMPPADAVWKSIKQQESGGQASPGTAVGPDTAYGNALGSTQMLPATAKAMADKLGVAWRPDLLQSNTPEALAYQDKLGRAYFDEGVEKGGGDVAQGAAYYFGGPDPALHGPKTKAYVQSVLARAAGMQAPAPELASAAGTSTLAGGQASDVPDMATAEAAARAAGLPWNPSMMRGDTPAAKAYQAKVAASQAMGAQGGIPGSAAQVPDWAPDPAHPGYLKNHKTGATKADPEADYRDIQVDPNEVKMLLDGRYPAPTSGRAATDPHWQALLAAAVAADPSFDAANYQTRVKTRQSFLNGKDAQNITALNTVVGHLDALDHAVDGLGNYGGFPGSTLNNRAAHFIAHESGTDQRMATFNAAKTAVANELTRVFRGSGGAEADIQGYLRQLDDAAGPETLHTAVRSIAGLIKSRLDAVSDTYKQGMGLSKDPMEFLHPEQQRSFARLSGQPLPGPQAPAATTPAAGGAAPAQQALAAAREAIRRGADPDKVKQRLVAAGINPADL